MKRLFPFFICLSLILSFTPITAAAAVPWPTGVSIEADGGILMDADTGSILYGKNENQAYYPASITKILTALIVLEECELDEMVTFSHDDVYNVEAGSSSAGIDEGDVLTVRDCLYALLLASANESANALACHVSGSREAFAELMNQKARSLGCTGSNFANPSGLNDENHYTTAHDMALITQEAIKNPDFVEISGTRSYQMAPTKKNAEGGYVANHHNMVKQNTSVTYPGAFAGKTGYTSLAGNTLVTYGEKDGRRVISVVLKGQPSPNYFLDGKTLLQFGFENFQNVSIPDNETKYVTGGETVSINGADFQPDELDLESGAVITLPKDAAFSDASMELVTELPEQHPERAVALLQYTYNDRKIGQAYLLAKEGSLPASSEETGGAAPEEKPDGKTDASDQKGGEEGSIALPPLSLPVIGICLLVFAVLLLSAYTLYTKKKEAEELRRRHERRMQRLKEENYTEEEFYELLGREKERLAGKRSQKRSSGSRPKKAEKKARSPKQMKTEGESPDESLENLDDLFFEDLDSSEENKNNFDI